MKKVFKSVFSALLVLIILAVAQPTDVQAIDLGEVPGHTITAAALAKTTSTSLKTPVLVSAVNANGGVIVNWKKVTGVKGYAIYRKTSGTGWSKIATVTGASTVSYLDKKASSGTTYTYTVRAYNGSKYSGYNKTGVSVKYLATPKLISAANTAKGVTVSWQKVGGAKKYRLYYSTNGGKNWKKLKDVTSTSYTITGGTSGKTYTYTVRAINGSAVSYYNKAGISVTKLTIPQLISAANTEKGVTVSWKKVTGAQKYRVYYSTDGGKKWSGYKDTTGTTYTFADVTSGKTYTYTVRAINGSSSSYYDKTGKTVKRLSEPVLNSAVVSDDTIEVTWKKVTGASGYAVYRKTTGGSWVRQGTSSGTSFIDWDAVQGMKYTYTVRAYSGNTYSSYDKAGVSSIILATPKLQGAKADLTGITVSWSKVAGASGYNVYRKTSGGSWQFQKRITGTSYVDTNVTSETTYSYTVRAYNGNVLSGYNKSGVSATFILPSLSKTSLTLMRGETASLTVQNAPGTVTWASSNSSVAKVENGTVTATGVGTASVTATTGGKRLTCTVTVSSNVAISDSAVTIEYPNTAAISLKDQLTGTELTGASWQTSNADVATVSNGLIIPVNIGTAVITASYDGENFNCNVTVTSAATLDVTSVQLHPDETAALSVTGNMGSVAWSSSDPSVATVTDGVVSARNPGTAVITAAVDGKTLTCSITVEADKTELNALISTASGYLNAQGMEMYYTAVSWSCMKSALSQAQTVSGNLTATVSQVNDAETVLQSALDGLTKLAFEDGELVYYPELSKQVLEEINDYREENGLNRLEWCENYADTCRIQASYNCMAYMLDYRAYEQYLAGNWDPARHTGYEIGAWISGGGAAESDAKQFVPMWQNSPLHNKFLLLDGNETLGGIAICSYTINGRSSGYTCIYVTGTIDVFEADYVRTCGIPITDFCTIDQVLNCTER